MTGSRLGHYRVLEKIGEGGMGLVYRAYDEQLHRDIALKVLPAGQFDDPAARARLLREARSAASLNHPHICTVYEVGEAEGQAFIAMELIDGQPLSTMLARGPLPPEIAQRYLLQLSDALAHAHTRGIIHRDFKSANVVITTEGRAKVLDFGLARRQHAGELSEVTQSQATLTETGAIVGTLAYMAPEQLRGQPTEAASDVWALGVVAYEMVCGARPFRGATGFEVSSAILDRPPAPLPAAIPVPLRTIIERCLAKVPEGRYRNGAEARAALEAAAAGITGPSTTESRRLVWRSRKVLAAAAATGVLLVAAALTLDRLGILVPGRSGGSGTAGSPPIGHVVVLPFTNRSGDTTQDHLADGITEELIAQLSKISGLRVISRTSAMQYKGTDKAPKQVAAELGVEGVVEGSFVREDDLVRVTVFLTDGRTDRQIWADSFEREFRGILALQSEVVRAIAAELRIKLSPQEETLLAGARPVVPEAYEAYLKGRMHWYKQTPQDVDTAEQYFQQALERDPGFALAYIGLGYVWIYRASSGLVSPREGRSRLTAIVGRALELDDSLAEAHEAEADFKFYYDWDWTAAGQAYERAVRLKPNSADMRIFYWDYLMAMKRPREAREQIERCLELDPNNSFVQISYGLFLLSSRRFEEAAGQFRKTIEANVDFGSARLGLWAALHHQGQFAEGLAEVRAFFATYGDQELAVALMGGPSLEEYRAAMRRVAEILVARSAKGYVQATQIAIFFTYAGDRSRALDWLERAYEARESSLVKLQVDPDWDRLRGEPRFEELVRRMNFPK